MSNLLILLLVCPFQVILCNQNVPLSDNNSDHVNKHVNQGSALPQNNNQQHNNQALHGSTEATLSDLIRFASSPIGLDDAIKATTPSSQRSSQAPNVNDMAKNII